MASGVETTRYEALCLAVAEARGWGSQGPLLGGAVAEDESAARSAQEPICEIELQASWFAGQFGRSFCSTEGERVEVVQFGEWNRSAGPDFQHVVVKVNGEQRRGSLELDPRASDWLSHGHSANPAYNDVVLHVVFQESAGGRSFTRCEDGGYVPRVVLEAAEVEVGSARPAPSVLGRCAEPLSRLPADRVSALLRQGAAVRAQRKALAVNRLVEIHGPREALWQSVARVLGYRQNQLPMLALAQRIPVRDLLGQGAERGAALLLGVAGFLAPDLYERAPAESRGYLEALWHHWWKERAEKVQRALPWHLAGVRPTNHPQRRVGALAALWGQWRRWERVLGLLPVGAERAGGVLEGLGGRLARIERELPGLVDDFWSYHYTLTSRVSAKKIALVGRDRARALVLNHHLPQWLQLDPAAAWAYYEGLKSAGSRRPSDSVRRAAHRLLGERGDQGDFLKYEWQQQGLLQVYQDFCLQDVSDCRSCPFPEQLAGW